MKLRALPLYAAAHFWVDFACALLVLGRLEGGGDAVTALLLYNCFAFAVQMPVGLLADTLGGTGRLAAMGCGLTALAWGLPGLLPAAVCAGLGNACFHVGGGLYTLNGSGRCGPLGLFVSPGALGIALGTLLAPGGAFPAWAAVLVLLGLGAALLRWGRGAPNAPLDLSPEGGAEAVPDGGVDFENVSFKYHAGAKEYALSGVNLHIPAGQTVGILGGTGSAKTTLVQLIPRLYDATEGTVRVGGRDVREYELHALRDAVGIVLQKNVLFSGTVRDNLKWGNPDATDAELWAACRAACADEFLERMPRGLDTDLGQGGVNVSGGQKQRLCIARTLLKHPKVLIFDDSTSAVDTATEAQIRAALSALPNVTKLIIAQRITSVMNTDQIVILEDGRIHAVGTHESLLESDPIYQEIYASQMKGGEEHGPSAQREKA